MVDINVWDDFNHSGDLDDLCDLEKKHSLHLKSFTDRICSLNTIQFCRHIISFLGMYYQFLGVVSLLGARIYWGQDFYFMGDFELGVR